MRAEIEQAIADYEHGGMTRRQLVERLTALCLGMTASMGARSQPASTFEAVGLNHIALRTPDVARMRDFYVKHLGMKVTRDRESSCFLTFGDGFLALFRSESTGMHHYCYSIRDYEADRVEETLKQAGLSPRRESDRIYFDDPDGHFLELMTRPYDLNG